MTTVNQNSSNSLHKLAGITAIGSKILMGRLDSRLVFPFIQSQNLAAPA